MSVEGVYSRRCWIDNAFQQATVAFKDGIITSIEYGKPSTFENIYDAGDKIVMPGIIDAHVHVNEPGRTEWEGFDTATSAAAAGGITTIIDMPLNAHPVTTTVGALKEKTISTNGKLHVNCGFYGGLVPGNYDELKGLINAGVLGIKAFLTHSGIDEFPNVSPVDLKAAMPLLANHHIPLLAHCELSDEEHHSDLDLYPTTYQAYLSSRPKEWENDAVAFMIGLCKEYNCPTHIVHVSSSDALELIRDAKKQQLPLTAETCPHYIYFNAEDIEDGKTIFKCAPPIREASNNELLKEAFIDGTLDLIASDHSPAPPAIKEIQTGNFQKAWGGIAGLQFVLPASWSALREKMSIEMFIPLLTEHPAKFLSLDHRKGKLKEGFDADITIWDPSAQYVIKDENILHRHKISPYAGENVWGKVDRTIVNGELVYADGRIVQKNRGRLVFRNS